MAGMALLLPNSLLFAARKGERREAGGYGTPHTEKLRQIGMGGPGHMRCGRWLRGLNGLIIIGGK